MIRFGALILVLLVSCTVSLPICNVSYWVNLNPINCTTSPNGTYSALNYSGNCTLSPDYPNKTAYKLIIDQKTKAVQTFTVYNDKSCRKGDEILTTKTPLSLNTCGPLLFMTSSTSSVQIGSLVFNCKQ
ncbi:unnamed protein product [Rotaria sp. Silwood2]|nr:unnamed protein product [Rotaria sp. Silwood2]CAF3168808.1 unnamed protein product [Rotaria sp. Silwood2]CAF4220232.1 unnamed protein product [Rotaria sp. Silwood2]CAF4289334.1 unnamed protein product [Rotaria sp. Silwood2]